jgi:putative metallohydrolase (TIGR04338 family)
MSEKYPQWYELPFDRWEDKITKDVYVWDSNEQKMRRKQMKTLTIKDTQRSKLYAAETAARNSYITNTGNSIRIFNSPEEIEEYISILLESAWAIKRWGHRPTPKLSCGGHERFAWCSKQYGIFLPEWAWNEYTLLHELAHWLHKPGYGTNHGRFFARTFLELVNHQIGKEFKSYLESAFKKYRVKFRAYPSYSKETLEKKRQQGQKLARQKHQMNDPLSALPKEEHQSNDPLNILRVR